MLRPAMVRCASRIQYKVPRTGKDILLVDSAYSKGFVQARVMSKTLITLAF